MSSDAERIAALERQLETKTQELAAIKEGRRFIHVSQRHADPPGMPPRASSPEPMEGFWGPVRTVLRESMPQEGIDMLQFTRQVILDPNFDPKGSLAIYSDHGVGGYVLAIAPQDGSGKGYITLLGVLPKEQKKGIGTRLLATAEQYLANRGCREAWISPYAPGYFTPGVDVDRHADGLKFLKSRGYSETSRPLAMERTLWDYQLPDSIEELARGHRPHVYYDSNKFQMGLATPALQFVSEFFPGHWLDLTRQAIADILDGDRSDRLQVAIETAESGPARVIGFAHHQAGRLGPIGVHPDYRGRGIGTVLLHASMRAQKHAGYRTSWFMWTDDATAENFYQPAGFKEIRRFAILKKHL